MPSQVPNKIKDRGGARRLNLAEATLTRRRFYALIRLVPAANLFISVALKVRMRANTMSMQDQAGHILIPGDTLIPDAEFCEQVLDGINRRAARRLDAKGLPFVMVRGRKFRPLNEGRTWLAGQIVRRTA
jgi:hypothetical protein